MSFPRSFQCGHCGVEVSLDAPGTSHRNHCPSCLWSRHLDRNVPGDRKADCTGGMEPIAVTVRGESRWVLIHRCTHCGRLRLNRTAADDNVLMLMRLAALPLASPPIPFAGSSARRDDRDPADRDRADRDRADPDRDDFACRADPVGAGRSDPVGAGRSDPGSGGRRPRER